MDLLMVNLVLLGWIERDLTRMNELVQAVSQATGEPVPDNYPVFRARRLPHGDGRSRCGRGEGVP
jgi:hypothetical protein